MSIKCVYCGRFISHADMQTGEALFSFEPLSEFGPEVSEWTCRRCVLPPAQVGRNAERQDREDGLGPKDEHAVDAESGDAPSLPDLPDLPDPDETRRDAA